MATKKEENIDNKKTTVKKRVSAKNSSSKKTNNAKESVGEEKKTQINSKTSSTKKVSTTKNKVLPKNKVKSEIKKASEEAKTIDAKISEDNVKNDEAVLEAKAKIVKTEVVDSKKAAKKETKPKKEKSKKILIFIIFILLLVIAGLLVYLFVFSKNDNNKKNDNPSNPTEVKLPKPELEDGERGKLGIDKNVNEKTIDKYLGRKDAVYRDMRMLEDPGDYEAIGGDRFLSGYIKGFEVVPLPYIIPVTNLPKEVGYTYNGTTLFFKKSDGSYLPNYEESMDIIERLFPKDKTIFLMCGGGGYAGMMKDFLVANGWNQDKIYVVGGYWYYNGKNKVDVPKNASDNYDFSQVPYHDIDFTDLKKIEANRHNTGNITKFYLEDEYYEGNDETFDNLMNKYNNLYDSYFKDVNWDKIDEKELERINNEYDKEYNKLVNSIVDYIHNLIDEKKTFVLGIFNDSGCGNPDTSVSHQAIKYAKKNNVYFYETSSSILDKLDIYYEVQLFPNVIIIKDGKVYTFLDYVSEEDEKIFDSEDELIKWINKYIYMSK